MTRYSRRELLQWTGCSLAGGSLFGAASQDALAESDEISVDQNDGGVVELPQKEEVVISGSSELSGQSLTVTIGIEAEDGRDVVAVEAYLYYQSGSETQDWEITVDLSSRDIDYLYDVEFTTGRDDRTLCTLDAELVEPPYYDDAEIYFADDIDANYADGIDEVTVIVEELDYGGYVHIEDADGNALGRTDSRITRTDERIDQFSPSGIDIELDDDASVDTPAELTAVATFDKAGDDPYLSSDDEKITASAQYEAPGVLEVVEKPASTSVIEGGEFTVAATVQNIGDMGLRQELTFTVADLAERSRTVSLVGGESTTETFSIPVEDSDAGEYQYELLQEGNGEILASDSITIQPAPVYDVTVMDVNTPVEGGTLDMTVQIENPDDRSNTQSVTLTVDNLDEESIPVSLAGGESTTETFSIPVEVGDAGEYQYELLQEDDERLVSDSITIQPAPVYDVTIEDVNTPVEGRTLDVMVQIENTDDRSDTQSVTLTVADLAEQSRAVSLAGGESTTESFSIPVEDGDAGEYDVSITTMNDTNSDSTSVSVFDQTPFLIEIQEVNEPVAGDDPLQVTATITNGGATSDTQTITLAVPDIGTESIEVSLGPGESTTEQLSLATEDAGTYSVTVESAEDSASQEAAVLAPVRFDVGISEIPTTVVAGEPIEVQVAVTNSGDVPGTQQVRINIFELGSKSREISIADGDTTTQTVTFETEQGDAGEYTALVDSGEDTASVELSVLKPATFDVETVESNEPVAGDDLEIRANITNEGGVSGGTAVTATVSETDSPVSEFGRRSTETAGVEAGGETEVSFGFQTDEVDDGKYTVTVTTDDTETTDTVTVASPAFGDDEDLVFLGSAGLGVTLSYAYARLLNRSG